ncbi:efflux RND transporter periplasmic adaptor subunit [Vibrio breoganii]|uniref:Efflux transporter periplasmic adaptor subunit n=1 Tax=Vibrio breoganii TaxID=553239 RepID=A0AAP8SX73_9VIBR|nr:efflux RND transporter periplasmic adaptor subunit [Vibrio breoganii]PMP11822.1 efflux transporter periplasmic adaptor subunit [Vibrio breoganii]
MQYSKTILTSTVVLLLSACQQIESTPKLASKPQRSIQVVELKDPSFKSTKQFTGVVHSQEKAGVAFRVPGTINELLVNKGDSVKKGQTIARLDPHDYQVALEELEARMLEAKSAHKLAKAELARIEQAIEDDAIAGVNLDRAISGYERSLSAVKVVQKNIQRAEDTLSYTELKAPFSGVIGSVNYEQHEQILPGIAVVSLQNNDELEVDIDVPENLIHEFKSDQPVQVTWYQAKEPLLATVSEIATEPHLIKQTYTVTMTLDKPSDVIFPGKSVTVLANLSLVDSSYCVPYSALLGNKNDMRVHVVEEGIIAPRSVDLDSIDANTACIKGDFSTGDQVVISGTHYLEEGDKADKITVREL